ncbi:hypothetical protein J7643_11765 [bacterium]|nr:hypothetical protein [bacterium]
MNQLLTQTRRMLENLTGAPMDETRDWAAVLSTLKAGKGDVILELPWQHPDAPPERHEVVLKHLSQDRVVYYNARSPQSLAVGTILPGNATIPERRVEGTGLESMPLGDLQRLFLDGEGAALLPTERRSR